MIESERHGNAIVIGGSMAGLLAARVLADHFSRVTIVDRDALPDGPRQRRGVPQGWQGHGLLAGGQRAMERLFPGLTAELVADGATAIDLIGDMAWHQPGGYRLRFASDIGGISMSRPLLEAGVRRRVRALANVAILDGREVAGLATSEDRARVTGVTLRGHEGEAAGRTIAADFVVDAGGRGSRAAAWLGDLGYARPAEEKIVVGVGYTSRLYRRRPGDLPGASAAINQPTSPRDARIGILLPIEGDRWIATFAGWLGDHAPADDEGFLAFARSFAAPDIHDVISRAEPLGDFATHKFPANLRRRYERLRRVPEGYAVIGDALCSFNPTYGQGMTAAALTALALDRCLREGGGDLRGLPGRYYRRAAAVVDTPWQMAAGGDFAFPGVTGEKAPGTDLINGYMARVLAAATVDPHVCRTLVEVANLLAPPGALFAPRVALGALRASLRRPAAAGVAVTRRAPSAGD